MPQIRKSGAKASKPEKTCFVVAEFGTTSESKKRSEQTLRHLIRAILEPRGYDVVRADEIHTPGLITHQIIEHLLDDDLVVADLTGNNPNVFYEMAVRHAAVKPIIHILTDEEKIPFDVKDVRTVYYALDDPDRLEDARQLFESAVEEIEKAPSEVRNNPISVVRHLRLLEASGDPEAVEMGEVLSAIKDIRDQLRAINLGSGGGEFLVPPPVGSVRERLFRVIDDNKGLISTEEVVERLGMKADTVARTLERMRRDKQIYHHTDSRGSGWSTIPF